MHRSTIIFGALTLLLIGGLGVVGWRLLAVPPNQQEGRVDASVALGLPDMRPQHQQQVVPARSAVVWDPVAQTIIFEQNGFERLPIASITKLMTAMVALDHQFPWGTEVAIELDEYKIGGNLLLQPGETVTMRDLLAASLLGSANNATLAYVRTLGIEEEEFVQEMNRKAVALGLEQTYFTDVTGLEATNISTAYEVVRMAHHAFSHYPDIAAITSQREYTFVIGGSGREHTIHNTNKMALEEGAPVTHSKTGYLYEAGYCLVVQSEEAVSPLVAAVLNSPNEDAQYQGIAILQSKFVP